MLEAARSVPVAVRHLVGSVDVKEVSSTQSAKKPMRGCNLITKALTYDQLLDREMQDQMWTSGKNGHGYSRIIPPIKKKVSSVTLFMQSLLLYSFVLSPAPRLLNLSPEIFNHSKIDLIQRQNVASHKQPKEALHNGFNHPAHWKHSNGQVESRTTKSRNRS